jgi:hypothetical protein
LVDRATVESELRKKTVLIQELNGTFDRYLAYQETFLFGAARSGSLTRLKRFIGERTSSLSLLFELLPILVLEFEVSLF